VQNTSTFITIFIVVNISARKCICARLGAYKYPPKNQKFTKTHDFMIKLKT